MLDCYKNYIGIRGYCRDGDTPPYSGRYINDLPGFTAEDLNSAANLEDIETHIDLFEQKVDLAFDLLKDDFFMELSKRYKVRAAGITETKKAGFYSCDDAVKFNPVSNIQRGIIVENRIRKSQKLTRLKVTEVTIWARQELDTFISIIDGNEITNIPVRTNAFEPVTLKVDYFLKTDQIFIVTNNSFVETYKSTVFPNQNYNYYLSCLQRCCNISSCNDFFIFGWDGNTHSFDTFGISAQVLMYCDYDNYWCSLKDILVLPMLYKTAFLLMEEAVFGTRSNFVRSASAEGEYLAYLDSKYREYLVSSVDKSEHMSKRIDSCCMPCKGASIVLHGV